MTTLYSVGHSNRSLADFLALLTKNKITAVADIRQFPRSRFNPQFNADTFAQELAAAGIACKHIAALGGRRSSKATDSPNRLWEHAAFRSYADYALTEPFEHGFAHLLEIAETGCTAMMCAEAVWWALPSPHRDRLSARTRSHGASHRERCRTETGYPHARCRCSRRRKGGLSAGAAEAALTTGRYAEM